MPKFANSKFTFLIGIGGSDLAAKAVWNAMTLHKTEESKPVSSAGKKIFFLESPDSREYEEVQNFVNNETAKLEDICLIAVSKSGQTAETLEAFHKTFDILSEKFGAPVSERVLVISTPGSPLWRLAESKNFEKIAWEDNIGGRFSAFTVAHTTVLDIAGTDIERFKDGSTSSPQEDASKLAKDIFDNYKKSADILDFFIFNSELEDLGKWCRQLIAESLAVLTPTVSIGPVDLHSMLELYLEKPENRFTVFVRSAKEMAGSVNESAYENATAEFQKRGLPHYRYEMPEINEYELGKFMQFMIDLTLALAKLLDVNPYDQPEVERYKKEITHP